MRAVAALLDALELVGWDYLYISAIFISQNTYPSALKCPGTTTFFFFLNLIILILTASTHKAFHVHFALDDVIAMV